MPHQLRTSCLAKHYPTPAGPLRVLIDICLELTPDSSPLAILGPSGSGKSTLLHLLGTLDTPTSGSFTLDGLDPQTLAPAARAQFRASRVGFIFQDHHLLPQCTALENVLLARLALGPVLPDHLARARELLNLTGLADRLTHFPSELSGGQRQRVAIARALMNAPSLLLCDEPTGDLDAETAAHIGQLLHTAARDHDALLIIATHSPSLAATCTSRRHLVGGRLVPEPT